VKEEGKLHFLKKKEKLISHEITKGRKELISATAHSVHNFHNLL
jgi:hypothetical protein